jgi:lipoate-protein ligase A
MLSLDLTLGDVAEDLALDEALLIEAEAGRGPAAVRCWEAGGFAVVLGASSRLREDVHVDACRIDGVPILRRSSGGGSVVVGPGALNVTLVLPQSAAPGLSTVDGARQYVLEWMVRSIRRAGRDLAISGQGDLTVGERKCAGSAQRRLKHWFMVHCSILYQFPIERIVRYLEVPRKQPSYRQGRTHQDFLSNLELSRQALVEAICPSGQPCHNVFDALSGPMALLPSLLAEKYANRAWIERFL